LRFDLYNPNISDVSREAYTQLHHDIPGSKTQFTEELSQHSSGAINFLSYKTFANIMYLTSAHLTPFDRRSFKFYVFIGYLLLLPM